MKLLPLALQRAGLSLLLFCILPGGMQAANKAVALFALNRGDPSLDSQLPILEDLITGEVTDLGFGILRPETVIGALSGAEQGNPENALDAALAEQSSALRLAQNLGADYLLEASLLGLDKETRTVKAYGVDVTNITHILRVSYRILNGNNGASLAAGTVSPTRAIQQNQHSTTSTPGLSRELMARAAKEIAAELRNKTRRSALPEVTQAHERVSFTITATLQDVRLPEIIMQEDGTAQLGSSSVAVQAAAVPVEVDGVAIGSTSGSGEATELKARPGLHRLRLARPDIVPFERTVNIYDGLHLEVALQLNEAGLQRWRENTAMLDDMKRDAVLTDATAEKIRGFAQMLRQSGYRIDIKGDYKSDITVDTDEGLTIEKNQSLMRQD
ncbi:MAG: hypothetical protein GVY10_07015 [Verrucomicrobia bacterium]|jgi:hypothetical protein|nr:hypothetical protein [Verrucomicrobiota bacterium]